MFVERFKHTIVGCVLVVTAAGLIFITRLMSICCCYAGLGDRTLSQDALGERWGASLAGCYRSFHLALMTDEPHQIGVLITDANMRLIEQNESSDCGRLIHIQ